MNPIFYGRIQSGTLNIRFRREFDEWLRKLEGKEVEIEVRKKRSKRTEQQNRWYWGCVVKIPADEFGYDPEEMHGIYKSEFLKERRVMKGRVYELIRSTTSLSTDEFVEYVEKCRRFAEEQGIIIPDPNEVSIG